MDVLFIKEVIQSFWEAPLDHLKQGYSKDGSNFVCLICGERFVKGRIYRLDEELYEAEKYAELHVKDQHGSMLSYLLGLDKKLTGLTDHQKDVIRYFSEGQSDKEVAQLLGTSLATVRSHRFSLREKAKQAKVQLAIAELMEAASTGTNSTFVDIHRTARMVDERYMITEAESQRILATYFPNGVDGPLNEFPRKEKRKLVILRHILTRFDADTKYSEAEVNAILQTAYADYVTLRRYLVEYGFLDRRADGSEYWVKDR